MRTKPPKTQVTVRISAEIVAYIDELVERGEIESRASYLDRAAERQRRWERNMTDLAILSRATDDGDDLDKLAHWSAQQIVDLQ
jgi:Arc/MetJ-type ribon-helix-helix transcriptional regulator